MGKKIRGRSLASQVLGSGQRLDECADVGDEGSVPVIKQRLNFGQVWIECEVRGGSKRQQGILRQGQLTADRRVIRIPIGVEGDEGVVGVVSAK